MAELLGAADYLVGSRWCLGGHMCDEMDPGSAKPTYTPLRARG